MTQNQIELSILRRYVAQYESAELQAPGSKCARELDMRNVLASITGISGQKLEYDANFWLDRLAPKARDSQSLLRRCSDSKINEQGHRWHARAYRDSGTGITPAWDRIRNLEESQPPAIPKEPNSLKWLCKRFFITSWKIIIAVVTGLLIAWAVYVCGPQAFQAKRQAASIELESPKFEVYQDDRTGRSWRVCEFPVQIRNTTSNSLLSVPHWKLTNLRRLENGSFSPWGEVDSVFLAWPIMVPRKLSPGDKVSIPFVRIFPVNLQKELGEGRLYSGDVNMPQPRFTVISGGWSRRMTSHIPPGTYRFKLSVFFEKEPPAEAELELEWPGQQRENVELMSQEIKLRKVAKEKDSGGVPPGTD